MNDTAPESRLPRPGKMVFFAVLSASTGILLLAWPVARPNGLSLLLGVGLGAVLALAALGAWVLAVIYDLKHKQVL